MADHTTSFMKIGGPCIKVTSNNLFLGSHSWIVPFTEEFQLTTAQDTKTPIKDFIKDLQDATSDLSVSLGLSQAKPIIDTVQKMGNLFGVQLNNLYYYASSWGGSLPSEFNITLNFYIGSLGVWDAKIEVYNPIMQVMQQTVPSNTNGILTAPMPSAASVFVTYGSQIVTGAIGAVKDIAGKGINAAVQSVVGGTASGAQSANDANDVAKKLMSRVWDVQFGWCDSIAGNFIPYYSVTNNVVVSSVLKFAPKVQQNADGKSYPIYGSVSLSLKSQRTMTNTDFVEAS